jgi:putative transposase
MSTSRDPLYRRHRFPPEVISYAVWLYFRFPLSLRMVEEMLAARGICVTYETVRQWGKKFGKAFSDQIRQRAPARGDKWHMDEVVVTIAGEPYWLWRAVDQNGLRSRRLGPASKRQSRCAAAHKEAPEIRRHTAARHDHGQAPFVRRCAGEDGPLRRTSPAQGPEQSRGKLSPADEATRTDHEAIQIGPAGTTVSVGSRSSREPLPHPLS